MAENDFIPRKEIYDALNDIGGCGATDEWAKGYDSAIDTAINIIESMPAADVVPVVRCKECKHYQNHPNGLCYLHTEPYGDGYKGDAVCVEDNDFCSYGERKELDNE